MLVKVKFDVNSTSSPSQDKESMWHVVWRALTRAWTYTKPNTSSNEARQTTSHVLTSHGDCVFELIDWLFYRYSNP